MRLSAGVVAILAVPLAVYAIDPDHATPVYIVAVSLYLSLGVGLLALSLTLPPAMRPDRTIDERAVDRRSAFGGLLGAAVIANFVLIYPGHLAPYVCGAGIIWTLIWLPAFDRRIGVTTQVVINRDPKTVFNFMLDGRNQMQYVPELVSVDKLTEGAIGPGTQFRSRVRMGETGIFEGVEEIVEVDWGQKIVDRVANGRLPNRGIMTFAPAPGGTVMTYRFESVVSYPSALLGQAAMRWLLTGQMRRRRLVLWARLKQVLESQPTS